MANHNISIRLNANLDKDGQTYYVGFAEGPLTIDLKDGAAFLVFISDKGEETLQIGNMDHKKKR